MIFNCVNNAASPSGQFLNSETTMEKGNKKGLEETLNPLISLVVRRGFEPLTFGL
jgi:hypothetical protein